MVEMSSFQSNELNSTQTLATRLKKKNNDVPNLYLYHGHVNDSLFILWCLFYS